MSKLYVWLQSRDVRKLDRIIAWCYALKWLCGIAALAIIFAMYGLPVVLSKPIPRSDHGSTRMSCNHDNCDATLEPVRLNLSDDPAPQIPPTLLANTPPPHKTARHGLTGHRTAASSR